MSEHTNLLKMYGAEDKPKGKGVKTKSKKNSDTGDDLKNFDVMVTRFEIKGEEKIT